jgi:hypothetical protein
MLLIVSATLQEGAILIESRNRLTDSCLAEIEETHFPIVAYMAGKFTLAVLIVSEQSILRISSRACRTVRQCERDSCQNRRSGNFTLSSFVSVSSSVNRRGRRRSAPQLRHSSCRNVDFIFLCGRISENLNLSVRYTTRLSTCLYLTRRAYSTRTAHWVWAEHSFPCTWEQAVVVSILKTDKGSALFLVQYVSPAVSLDSLRE